MHDIKIAIFDCPEKLSDEQMKEVLELIEEVKKMTAPVRQHRDGLCKTPPSNGGITCLV